MTFLFKAKSTYIARACHTFLTQIRKCISVAMKKVAVGRRDSKIDSVINNRLISRP